MFCGRIFEFFLSHSSWWVLFSNVREMFSLRKQPTFCDAVTGSPPSDVWETSAEIPYWWRISTQIWVVLMIGCAAWKIWFNQSEILSRSGSWCVISMKFLCSFLRRHLVGKPFVESPSVGCFLRLGNVKFYGSPKSLGIMKYC